MRRLMAAVLFIPATLHATMLRAATICVDDSGDGAVDTRQCDATCSGGDCSLREAITKANAEGGGDAIIFSSALRTLTLTSELPHVTQPITLTGTTGLTVHATTGLTLAAGADGSVVQDLALEGPGSGGIGITVSASRATLRRNVLGNLATGIRLQGGGEHDVAANWIGMRGDGESLAPVSTGIVVSAVSSAAIGARNYIAATTSGIVVEGTEMGGITLFANQIGVLPKGIALSPGWPATGIAVRRSGVTVDSNIVCAKQGSVLVGGSAANGTRVLNNWIGLYNDGVGGALPCPGVIGLHVQQAAQVLVEENVIGNGTTACVQLDGATGAYLVKNHIGTDPGGLVAHGCPAGVRIAGNAVTIGPGNLISGNGVGVHASGGVNDVSIVDNRIGTGEQGALPNSDEGIRVSFGAKAVSIRGNIVSGNANTGIRIDNEDSVLTGNIVGLTSDGVTPLPNAGVGILLAEQANRAVIGGTGPRERNTIGSNAIGIHIRGGRHTISNDAFIGNTDAGVSIDAAGSRVDDSVFSANHIGVRVAGSNAVVQRNSIADSAVAVLVSGKDALIGGTGPGEGNEVFDNEVGVSYAAGLHTRVLGNSTHDNRGLGIALEGDGQQPPTPTSAVSAGGKTRAIGTLPRSGTYRVELFSSPTCDEGETFLGGTEVSGVGFDVTVPGDVPEGHVLTATLTGDETSQYSMCVPVGRPGAIVFAGSSSASESDGSVTLRLQRVTGSGGDVSVQVDTSDGGAKADTDYVSLSTTVTFAHGVTEAQITVQLVGDRNVEGEETFTVSLSNPQGGALLAEPAYATVTIYDDDCEGCAGNEPSGADAPLASAGGCSCRTASVQSIWLAFVLVMLARRASSLWMRATRSTCPLAGKRS